MMSEAINENFSTLSHNILVKTAEPSPMIPIQKFHHRQTEWTLCSAFDKGEFSMALMLDWCKQKPNGVFAGMHGEIRSGQGCFISRKTKMYFFRPGDHHKLDIRLLPEECYRRQTSNGRGQPPNISCFVQVTITLAYDLPREKLTKFLTLNSTIIQSIPWPMFANPRKHMANDCTIKFLDGTQLKVHKATALARLDNRSPMHVWNKQYPCRNVFHTDIAAPECVKSTRLFHQLIRTDFIPWRKFDFEILHGLLKLAKYFRYMMLLQLCGVQLIHIIRDDQLSLNEISQLKDLGLPSMIGILECHQVTNLVQPEVADLPSTTQGDT